VSYQIQVQNLGKKYKRYANRWARLAEWLSFGRYQAHRSSWVFRDLNFNVEQGEALGIIGINGAGKSTLLKLLTKTSIPTEGSIEIHGRVAALLELGMGFHKDFSGRVNALMTCQMMGYSSEEAHRLIDGIREFSELGDYLDQPVRVYSTGMQVRLAFSAATVIQPEILIVDEALSVGDAYFQHKCIARIREYRDKGTTLLFVSHDPGAVKSLCSRAILLDGGKITQDGSPDTVLDFYNSVIARKNQEEEIRQVIGEGGGVSTRSGNGNARIVDVDICTADGVSVRTVRVGEQVALRCSVTFYKDMSGPAVGFLLRDRMGNDIFGTNTSHLGHRLLEVTSGDCFEFNFSLPLNVGVGNYSICVAVHGGETHLEENCDWWDRCLAIQVVAGNEPSFVGVAALATTVDITRSKAKD
jgi:lipopolysaccharide transport system ATP-binding protein